MADSLEELGLYIQKNLSNNLNVGCKVVNNSLVLFVAGEDLVRVLHFLRDNANCQFKQLVDVCGVDYPEREKRFEVVYQLLSLKYNKRVRVKVRASEDSLVPSVVKVFSSANWLEREVFDMYGVHFDGHPDLRRILTDYGFDGYPLRKDFPLTGYTEVRYDDDKKSIVYEPVKLDQEYRHFDFSSPWEGGDYVLPGDEKVEAE